MSSAPNPRTFSSQSTLKLTVAASVGLDCTALMTGPRRVLSMFIRAVLDSTFAAPARSCTRAADMFTASVRPSAGSATSKVYLASKIVT